FLCTPLLLYMAYTATQFAAKHDNHNTLAAYVQVACWILQFIGHGFAEKRSPTLLDNLAQAVLLAPLFVWFEVLFFLGYRSALQHRVNAKVEAAIAEFKSRKQKSSKKVE
ncbi:3085_t:CDS:2, partial [Ambispora leptoticha]